jgi:hypothetical protein
MDVMNSADDARCDDCRCETVAAAVDREEAEDVGESRPATWRA